MSIYKKRINIGAFLKKGEDFKEDDIIEIASEGKQVEGQYGTQDIFLVKLSDGKEGNVSFNSTSVNNLIDAFGEDSKNWIGKKVKVWAILSNVQGKMIKVYYFSHPDAELSKEGLFELSGKKDNKDIPTVEDDPRKTSPGVATGPSPEPEPEPEIDPGDIPF